MSDIQQRLQEAQGLLGQKAADRAQVIVEDILEDHPAHVEARYTRAVIQRVQRHWPEALATLDSLLADQPTFGRAYQEAGLNHVAMKELAKAGNSFERAVSCDPGLLNSWQHLAQLYKDTHNAEKFRKAADQIAFLQSLPRELLTVISYMSEDRLADAERLCKFFLQSNKTHVEGIRLLAEIATRTRVFEDAEFLLESAVEFEPGHTQARTQYANILLRTQKFDKAWEQARMLLDKHPDDMDTILALYASACMGVGKNKEAIECYRQLMRAHPDNHFFPLSLAHVLKSDGDLDAAVEHYRKSYELKPDHGDAYWSLANAKSYTFTSDEIQRMQVAANSSETGEDDLIQLNFALGKAYEDMADFERAFSFYDVGNSLKKEKTHHHEKPLAIRIDSQIEICTPELFADRVGVGCPAADPIFVVGMPRAGSTLLEQILSSHSQVDGTMELHNILNLAKRLRGRQDAEDGTPRYPAILGELEHDYFRRFGEQFIEQTQAYRGDAPFFIDKMPNNFFHVGLIRLILPNAKIIDARRHPMGCCFSGFKQLFGEGQEFSYSLTDIGNYYRQYVKLMDHWDTVLPGYVLRVQYEDVIADLETQVRRMLEFLELPFEQACLEYHKTERSIRTPSAEQVRQPIYKSGLDQWRNFEPWLEPLKEALGPQLLARYPIE